MPSEQTQGEGVGIFFQTDHDLQPAPGARRRRADGPKPSEVEQAERRRAAEAGQPGHDGDPSHPFDPFLPTPATQGTDGSVGPGEREVHRYGGARAGSHGEAARAPVQALR